MDTLLTYKRIPAALIEYVGSNARGIRGMEVGNITLILPVRSGLGSGNFKGWADMVSLQLNRGDRNHKQQFRRLRKA